MKATANHHEGLATISEFSAHDPEDISRLPLTWNLTTCRGKVPRRAGQTGKPSVTSGKARYRRLYQTELEQEAEWLRRGAVEKVNSIEGLLRRNGIQPTRLLELGCGVGAVIVECQRRNLAASYAGVDYAPEAIDYLRGHSDGIEATQADLTDPSFHLSDPADVVILSHVLEHLESPATLLRTLKDDLQSSYLVIEVPLEDLMASRAKSLVKNRSASKAGHVQFFTARTFELLVRCSGFRVIDRRTYVPVLDAETVRFVAAKDGLPEHGYLLKLLTSRHLPTLLRPLWKRLYYAHHAVLCVVDD